MITIRPYRPDDLDAVKRLTVEAFDNVTLEKSVEDTLGILCGRDWRWRKARHLDEDAAANPAGIFVAEAEGRVVGYITTHVDREAGKGRIPNLAVAADFRGHGLGRRLIEHALEIQGNNEQTKAAALLSPQGNLTIMVLNKAENERTVSMSVSGLKAGCTVHKYQVMEAAVGRGDFRMEPLQAFAISPDTTEIGESLPARSITVYSTFMLADADPGIIAED